MEIFVENKNETINIDFEGIIEDLVKKLDLNLEEVIVVKNNELVTSDESVSNKDSLKILSVVSGG